MKMQMGKPFVGLVIFVMIVSLACNIGSSPTSAPAPTVAVQQPTQAEPVATKAPVEPPTSGAVSNLDDVQKAVVQIEADGTFIDPEVGWEVNVGKMGTGFIIDPSGIAVTNNHVVTGAALLKVWVGGDTKVRNAKVLGVSECSDLAVIKIDGGPFPYMEWYDGAIKVGLKVFAAGFPLGDPNFTLTDGIVSKSSTTGETSWASVDAVIQHSAKINPGNSGGPLVDENGKVVGINYAAVAETDQNFAIGRDEALKVIDQLKTGKNVDSMGINGGAVSGKVGDVPISGIWVRSVASGSPADKALVQPGDIIYQLEGQVLATDGTMADYCDILRSHNLSDTLAVTVIRFKDLSLMDGQFNGRQLATTGYFSGSQSSTGTTTPTSGSDYNSYVTVQDNSKTIEMEIPAEWTQVDGSAWQDSGKTIGVSISAAADLQNLYNTWNESGVFFGASDQLAQLGGYIQVLDATRDSFKECKLQERQNYNDGLYKGAADIYKNCGGQGGTQAMVLSAVPADNSQAFEILVELVVTKDADLNALDHIIKSFKVIGSF